MAAPGPVVIGGTGGSGTRLFARLARAAGFHLGADLNISEDQLEIADFYDRWLNRWLLDPDGCDAPMRIHLAWVIERHRAGRPEGEPWGWKEPRSIFLLRFLDAALQGMRFVHVVRDGRDMAFSKNRHQLRKHGATFLGSEGELSPHRSIALWARLNGGAADYGEGRMGERYLRLRFEDMLDDPDREAARLARFLQADQRRLAGAVALEPPASAGAWRRRDPETIAGLERVAGEALGRFGYL